MSNDRKEMRQVFLDAWQKRDNIAVLSALEQQLLNIIRAHKEYEPIFDDPDILNKDYQTHNNPFLHMSLHLAVIEQLTTNRPEGIQTLYQQGYKKYNDEHSVQHIFMEVMGDTIYEAQQKGLLPDEHIYLERLKKILSKGDPKTQ